MVWIGLLDIEILLSEQNRDRIEVWIVAQIFGQAVRDSVPFVREEAFFEMFSAECKEGVMECFAMITGANGNGTVEGAEVHGAVFRYIGGCD